MWALVIGLVLAGGAYLGYAGKYKGIAMIVGGLFILAALFMPGYGYWGDAFEYDTGTTDTTTVLATTQFDIEMSNGSWATGNITGTAYGDGTGVTYQLNQDGTYTFDEIYLSANFSLSPVAPTGATNDELITISWSMNEEATYDGDDIFSQTSDVYDVDFWVNGITAATSDKAVEEGSGSWTMQYTDDDYITMAATLSSGSADTFAENMDTVGESYTVPITFSCGSWSETFDIDFVVITNA